MFDRSVHAYLRARLGARAHRVGPFLVGIDPHDAGVFRNYAVPDDGARPTAGEVDELVTAFVDRDRVPRLEYLPSACPDLEQALTRRGFSPERRIPVMTCTSDQLVEPPVPPGVAVGTATTAEALLRSAEVQNEAYGMGPATSHDVDRLRAVVDAGGIVGLAVDEATGDGVGSGLCEPPQDGVAELAGVGVREPYRRRGIAAAVTASITRACPAAGITSPFLTPAGAAEERIYAGVGYRPVAEMLHISLG